MRFLSQIAVLFLLVAQLAAAAPTPPWHAEGNVNGRRPTVWFIDYLTNAFCPAADAAYNIGSAALRALNVYTVEITANQETFARAAAITASTNLTAASPTYNGVSNMTAVIYLPDATTVPAGRKVVLKAETATAGNIAVWPRSTQTIDAGTGNVNITTLGSLKVVGDGANWWKL